MESNPAQLPSPDNLSLPLEIDVVRAKSVIDAEQGVLLLDCREAFEREICRLEPSLFIPMQQTPQRLEELEPYRQQRIIVYCHAGVRSYHLASWLRGQGFSKAQSMTMGIEGWSLYVDPAIPRY